MKLLIVSCLIAFALANPHHSHGDSQEHHHHHSHEATDAPTDEPVIVRRASRPACSNDTDCSNVPCGQNVHAYCYGVLPHHKHCFCHAQSHTCTDDTDCAGTHCQPGEVQTCRHNGHHHTRHCTRCHPTSHHVRREHHCSHDTDCVGFDCHGHHKGPEVYCNKHPDAHAHVHPSHQGICDCRHHH